MRHLDLSGRDHAALAVMPVTVATAQRDLKPWTSQYQIRVDGEIQRFDLRLEPGVAGWPTHEDQLIYLALLQLAVQRSAQQILVCKRSEVFELLDWPTAGYYYDRLRSSLERLTALTIFINSTVKARNGREYSEWHGVHLIDRASISKGRDAQIHVRWGDVVTQAFELNDLKLIDWSAVRTLGNPLTVQLYRLLDRAVMSGDSVWEVGWKPLARALGMDETAYNRPAKFRTQIEPHIQRLIDADILAGWEYKRGGTFLFQVNNYLRGELRRVLGELGVYPDLARRLVAGHDAIDIIVQLDHLAQQTNVATPAAWLVEAVRNSWEPRYSDEEPEAFNAAFQLLTPDEREDFQEAALRIHGGENSLFATSADPTAWPIEMRAAVRFMLANELDPKQVMNA